MTTFGIAVLAFVAVTIVVAVRAEQRRLRAEPWRACPLESDGIEIPSWVNDGRPLEQRFVEAIDFALWEADQLVASEDEDA